MAHLPKWLLASNKPERLTDYAEHPGKRHLTPKKKVSKNAFESNQTTYEIAIS